MAKNKNFLCKKEIAALYNVSVKTISRILEAHKNTIGDPVGYTYTPVQVEKIKDVIGEFETI